MSYKLVIHNLTKYQAEYLRKGIKLDKGKNPITIEEE